MTPNKILFCTDFSQNSEPAFRLTTDRAESFWAALLLFHVIDPDAPRYPRFNDLVPLEETLKRLEFACDRKLSQMREEIEEMLPSVMTCSANGVPAKKVVDFAKKEEADLIVMGTHGRKGLRRLLSGSTAEDVARTGFCPVLIVRPTSVPY